MTILQFQQLYFITQSKDHDLDKSIKMAGAVTGLTPEQVELMPMPKFNKLCAKINKQFELLHKDYMKGKPKSIVFIKGRWYKLHYRVDRQPVNAGRFVEVAAFGADVIPNLHKIMASIAEPVRLTMRGFVPYERLHEDIATDMESLNFEAAYHAAVFFYTLYGVSMNAIRPYLVKELVRKGVRIEEAEEQLKSLSLLLDGFTTPKWSQSLKPYLLNRFGS